MRNVRLHRISILGCCCVAIAVTIVAIENVSYALPQINVSVGGETDGPAQVSSALKILAMLTILSLAPAILMMMTCFTRIVVVLSFVRQALGLQGMPPNQVMMGLALILTFFVMAPVGKKINEDGLQPYLAGKLADKEALDASLLPLRTFMLDQTRTKDLSLFLDLTATPPPESRDDVPLLVVIPSFVLSELTSAFHMGFLIFIPFVLLDFIIASILMSMGMVMLPPSLVSMPLKVMLFVIVDGWHLVITSLVRSVAV